MLQRQRLPVLWSSYSCASECSAPPADSRHLCRWGRASGALLTGWRGLPSPPTPAWALAGRSGGDAEHVALGGSSLESPGSSSSCHTKASCADRDKSPFLIVEQKNRPSPSSQGRGGVAQGLCLICSLFPRLRAAQEATVGTSTFWKKQNGPCLYLVSGWGHFLYPTLRWPLQLGSFFPHPSLASGLMVLT